MLARETINKILENELKEKRHITRCKECSGLDCCGNLGDKRNIEQPFLSVYDVGNIEFYTGLKTEDFAVKKENKKTGNHVYLMKTLENMCVFFNRNWGKCDIFFYLQGFHNNLIRNTLYSELYVFFLLTHSQVFC